MPFAVTQKRGGQGMPFRRLILALVAASGFHAGAFAGSTKADFAGVHPSWAVRSVANWVVKANDNGTAAFFVIDKRNARLYVFNPGGQLQGTAPILLGLARGDDSVPGIGEKPLAAIRPAERTTPAGRFVAERGRNAQGEDIVWVNYADAISLHRVRTLDAKERRLERLRTPSAADNRISYGCINVPVAFYNDVVERAWDNGGVVVYVLPETKSLGQVFPERPSFVTTAALVRRMG
jgi:hypothetical protein